MQTDNTNKKEQLNCFKMGMVFKCPKCAKSFGLIKDGEVYNEFSIEKYIELSDKADEQFKLKEKGITVLSMSIDDQLCKTCSSL